MEIDETSRPRRHFLRTLGGASAALFVPPWLRADVRTGIEQRAIPSSGELIPAIGMGTFISFNVGRSERLRRERAEVLQTFLDLGGGMIDSSPMYGSSEAVMGHCLKEARHTERMFSATKVWTSSDAEGREQMRDSQRLWGLKRFDLQQVHNLVNWESHLAYLRELKEAGTIRYIGVTTSHGRRHRELEKILETEALDFVQLTYNLTHRETEKRLIPLAKDRGVGVIVNRPFDGGGLFSHYAGKPLPVWKDDVGATDWASFFLKYIISLPGVTCAIPATSRVEHMRSNMAALRGVLPDAEGRKRMSTYLETL